MKFIHTQNLYLNLVRSTSYEYGQKCTYQHRETGHDEMRNTRSSEPPFRDVLSVSM